MSFNQSVLICDQVAPILNDILQKNGLKITYEPEITPDQIKEKIGTFDIVIVRSRTKLTKDMIEKADKCKIIARVGVGLDNIDVDAANTKGIKVINAVEGAMNAVAELVLGLMLSLAREIPRADREIRNGKWLKKELIKTDLDTLLSSADYISFHVPFTNDTQHLVNSQRLGKMKKTAYIINTSRGEIIDEEALYTALKDGKIAGAALDVFEKEPATGNKLATLPNVICTPHIGAQTKEAQTLAANVIAEKIIMILRGVI